MAKHYCWGWRMCSTELIEKSPAYYNPAYDRKKNHTELLNPMTVQYYRTTIKHIC
jgi:hypothetical protein